MLAPRRDRLDPASDDGMVVGDAGQRKDRFEAPHDLPREGAVERSGGPENRVAFGHLLN
jgi:hypothetical protein